LVQDAEVKIIWKYITHLMLQIEEVCL
jgi:hypothetical protein